MAGASSASHERSEGAAVDFYFPRDTLRFLKRPTNQVEVEVGRRSEIEDRRETSYALSDVVLLIRHNPQLHIKRRPLAEFGLEVDLTAQFFDDGVGNRQSEAGAAVTASQ